MVVDLLVALATSFQGVPPDLVAGHLRFSHIAVRAGSLCCWVDIRGVQLDAVAECDNPRALSEGLHDAVDADIAANTPSDELTGRVAPRPQGVVLPS